MLGLAACDGGGSGGDIDVDSIEPAQGPLGGGQTVLIEGSGFLSGGSAPDLALFGGVLTTQVSALSDTQLQVVTPHNAEPGEVDVLVFNTNGYNLAERAYTYVDPPTITDVDASSGHYKGGDEVTVTGTGFQEFEAGQPTLTFDGVPATNVRVQSDTEILAIVPGGLPFHFATAALSNNRGNAQRPEAYLYTGVGFLAMTQRGLSQPPRGMFFIDAETAEVTYVRDFATDEAQVQGMATDEDGRVYASMTHLDIQRTASPERSLYTIDPLTGGIESIGPMAPDVVKGLPQPMRVTDLEFHDGTLYGFNRQDSSFGSIDISTGIYNRIGDQNQGYGCCGPAGLVSDGDNLYYIVGASVIPVEIATGLQGSPRPIFGLPASLYGWTYYDGAIYGVQRVSGDGGGSLRGGNGGGVSFSRILRVDLDDEELTAFPFATIPARIHSLTRAPDTFPGGDQ
jgi:hypothetical protein